VRLAIGLAELAVFDSYWLLSLVQVKLSILS
jgi:hypothetical protein